jgi:hypothetical protein
MADRVIVVNRGGKVLIHNRFKYQKNRQRTESIYWRCWRKEFRANLRTNIFDLINMNPDSTREWAYHEEDYDMIGKNETLNQMKDAIREVPTVPYIIKFLELWTGEVLTGNIYQNSMELEHQWHTQNLNMPCHSSHRWWHYNRRHVERNMVWWQFIFTPRQWLWQPCIHHRWKSNMPTKMPGGIHGRHLLHCTFSV